MICIWSADLLSPPSSLVSLKSRIVYISFVGICKLTPGKEAVKRVSVLPTKTESFITFRILRLLEIQ